MRVQTLTRLDLKEKILNIHILYRNFTVPLLHTHTPTHIHSTSEPLTHSLPYSLAVSDKSQSIPAHTDMKVSKDTSMPSAAFASPVIRSKRQ